MAGWECLAIAIDWLDRTAIDGLDLDDLTRGFQIARVKLRLCVAHKLSLVRR